jgi:hypothetical protein
VTVDELLRSIWRRRALFGAVLFAALAAIVAVTFALERRYESTATLYVGPPLTEEGPATLDVNVGEQLSRTYSTLASNPNVAEAVLGRLDLDLTRDELLDRMGFAPVERTQLLQISAQAESRELAQRIAQTYATVFVERIADRVRRGAECPGGAVVVGVAPDPHAVERDPGDRDVRVLELVECRLGGEAARALHVDHEHDRVGGASDERRVGADRHRRGVDDHAVVLAPQLGEQAGEALAGEQRRRRRRGGPRPRDVQVAELGLRGEDVGGGHVRGDDVVR